MGATMRRYIGTVFGFTLLMVVGSTYAFWDDVPVPAKPKPAQRPAEERRNKPPLQSGKAKEEPARSPQWADSDNGADINWAEAKDYCASKGSGWVLPTVAELQSSYQSGHLTVCGSSNGTQITCKVSSNSRLNT